MLVDVRVRRVGINQGTALHAIGRIVCRFIITVVVVVIIIIATIVVLVGRG